MNTNKVREESIKWFRELSYDQQEDLASEFRGYHAHPANITGREIENIYRTAHLKEKETPETVEEAASNLTNFIKNEALPESKKILTELKLINATNDLAKSKAIISELLDALNRVNRVENAAFGLPGFNVAKMKEEMQAAITKANNYLTQK